MSPSECVNKNFKEHIDVADRTLDSCEGVIREIGEVLVRCLSGGGTILWCGNGGSAADSQHIAAELVGRYEKSRQALRSIALTTDTSILTCVSNDFGYDDIFSRQVEALAKPGDVLVGISTSGNSKNVKKAFQVATEMGVETVALLGKGGGDIAGTVNHELVVPSDRTSRIQEMHILVGHIFCELIETELKLD